MEYYYKKKLEFLDETLNEQEFIDLSKMPAFIFLLGELCSLGDILCVNRLVDPDIKQSHKRVVKMILEVQKITDRRLIMPV